MDRPGGDPGRLARRTVPFIWVVAALAALVAVLLPLRLLADRGASGPSPAAAPRGETAGRPLPPCTYGDRPARFDRVEDWRRTLLDTRFGLPETYEPEDLVSTTQAGFQEDQPIREVVIEDLAALRRAAEEAGNPIAVIWGYRSYETQRSVFETWAGIKGRAATLRTAARPGHSEHQLGTALDFKSEGADDVDETWGSEPAGRWMRRHAWRFGFLMSYPRGEQDVTCYAYEPWHYRYFGRPLAAAIRQSGLTTREYLWRHGRDIEPDTGR